MMSTITLLGNFPGGLYDEVARTASVGICDGSSLRSRCVLPGRELFLRLERGEDPTKWRSGVSTKSLLLACLALSGLLVSACAQGSGPDYDDGDGGGGGFGGAGGMGGTTTASSSAANTSASNTSASSTS